MIGCASVQLPKLVDSQKLRSEAQRVMTRSRQGRRLTTEANATETEQVAALLSWCQAVCSAHGLVIHNFRTSFADARGLCWLVSFCPSREKAGGTGLLSAQLVPRSLQRSWAGHRQIQEGGCAG